MQAFAPAPGRAMPDAAADDGRPPIAPPGTPVHRDTGRLRAVAHEALARQRLDDARLVLERALELAPQDLEVLSDLAALALRTGDAARALAFSARGLEREAAHLGCRFTQAFALAAAGQAQAARAALEALTQGTLGEALRQEEPALASLAADELARLSNAPPGTGAAPALPVLTLPLAARFDLLVKLLYVLHRREQLPGWVTVDVPALYARHLHLRRGPAEADDGPPALAARIARFDALIDHMAEHGFDASQPVRLSSASGLPADGAHRLATALALGRPATLETVDAPGERWDLPWFRQHGFDPEDCNVLLRTWARLRGDSACVALLWAPAETNWPRLEARLAEEMVFVGARTLELPRAGFEEFVRDVQSLDAAAPAGPMLERRIERLRAWPARVRVVFAERRGDAAAQGPAAVAQRLCARLDGVPPPAWAITLQLSTTPAEARHLLDIVASEHNLAMLRRRTALAADVAQQLAALRDALAAQGLAADEACVVGSGVLAALGLRAAGPVEVTLRRESRHPRFGAGRAALAPGVELVAEGYARGFGTAPAPDDDQLITSPARHFRVRGLRFAAPAVVRAHMQHARREEDLRDLPLLADLADPMAAAPSAA